MQRRLLRDGRVVVDDWSYLEDTSARTAPSTGLIVNVDQWLADKPKWLATGERLGVVLTPAHKVEQIAFDLARFGLICAEFTGPSEGRGYTQGRLLRERYHYAGELRATGYVRHDQLFFLARCGFNSFELPEAELANAAAALDTFSAEYQPSNDAGLAHKLSHR